MPQVMPARNEMTILLEKEGDPSPKEEKLEDFHYDNDEIPLAAQQMLFQLIQYQPPLTLSAKGPSVVADAANSALNKVGHHIMRTAEQQLEGASSRVLSNLVGMTPGLQLSDKSEQSPLTDRQLPLQLSTDIRVQQQRQTDVRSASSLTDNALMMVSTGEITGRKLTEMELPFVVETKLETPVDQHNFRQRAKHDGMTTTATAPTAGISMATTATFEGHHPVQDAAKKIPRSLDVVTRNLFVAADVAKKNGSELKYNFSRWGDRHYVNISQSAAVATIAIQPSDPLVQQRLIISMPQGETADSRQHEMSQDQEQRHPQQHKRQQHDKDESC